MTPAELGQIRDPQARAVKAHSCAQEGEATLRECREVRDSAIAELRIAGWTQRRIAALLDLSPAAIALIDKSQGLVTDRVARR